MVLFGSGDVDVVRVFVVCSGSLEPDRVSISLIKFIMTSNMVFFVLFAKLLEVVEDLIASSSASRVNLAMGMEHAEIWELIFG